MDNCFNVECVAHREGKPLFNLECNKTVYLKDNLLPLSAFTATRAGNFCFFLKTC